MERRGVEREREIEEKRRGQREWEKERNTQMIDTIVVTNSDPFLFQPVLVASTSLTCFIGGPMGVDSKMKGRPLLSDD